MKTMREPCGFCLGTGQNTCNVCNGTGKWPSVDLGFPNRSVSDRTCSFCGGKGTTKCMSCGGRGYREVPVFDFSQPRINIPKVDISPQTPMYQPTGTVRPTPTSRPTPMSTRGYFQSNAADAVIALVILAIISGIVAFGFKETLVAAEGFFLFGGFMGLRFAAYLFHKEQSERLETFRANMAIGFGLCAGLLAAYLLLTTPEGRAINQWVTARTIRLVGSLFASMGIPVFLELVLRKILSGF